MQTSWWKDKILYYHRDNFPLEVYDAVGPKIVGFKPAPGSVAGMTITLVSAGASVSSMADFKTGYKLITDLNEDDGVNAQWKGSHFECLATTWWTIVAKIQCDEATQSDIIMGIAPEGSTGIRAGVADWAYFDKPDGTTAIRVSNGKNSTETATAAVGTLAASTEVELAINWDGTKLNFYINRTLVASHTTNIPDDVQLAPSLVLLAGAVNAKTAILSDWRGFQFTE